MSNVTLKEIPVSQISDDDTKVVICQVQQQLQAGISKERKEFVAPTSLEKVEERISMLINDAPSLDDTMSLSPTRKDGFNLWCKKVDRIDRDFELLINFIAPLVYKWSTERTGNSSQNIDNLQKEVDESLCLLSVAANSCRSTLYPPKKHMLAKEITTEEEDIVNHDEEGSQDSEIQNIQNEAVAMPSPNTGDTTTREPMFRPQRPILTPLLWPPHWEVSHFLPCRFLKPFRRKQWLPLMPA